MSSAFKVGLMGLLTSITIFIGAFYIWKVNPYSNYALYANFPHIGNLTVGSYVTLMGVRIGEVMAIEPLPLKRQVKVSLQIQKEMQLPKGSKFAIVTTGLVGSQNIEILPPPLNKMTQEVLAPESMVNGLPPASLDQIFNEAQSMLKSTRDFIENKDLRNNVMNTVDSIAKTASQLEGLFKGVKGITGGFQVITKQTEFLLKQINGATASTLPEIRTIVLSTKNIVANMEALSGRVNQIAQDPAVFSQTKRGLNNVVEISEKWKGLTDDLKGLTQKFDGIANDVKDITGDVKEITHDPEVKKNVKTVAKNATNLTKAVLNFTDPVQNQREISMNFRAETLGSSRLTRRPTTDSTQLNENFHLTPGAVGNFNMFGDLDFEGPITYFRVGMDEIGDGNLINLQVGSHFKDEQSTLRFGLIRGKLGGGADFDMKFMQQPLTVTGELYDINAPRMRLGLLQNMFSSYGLSAYWDNQFGRGINEFNLGFRWQMESQQKGPGNTAGR